MTGNLPKEINSSGKIKEYGINKLNDAQQDNSASGDVTGGDEGDATPTDGVTNTTE